MAPIHRYLLFHLVSGHGSNRSEETGTDQLRPRAVNDLYDVSKQW